MLFDLGELFSVRQRIAHRRQPMVTEALLPLVDEVSSTGSHPYGEDDSIERKEMRTKLLQQDAFRIGLSVGIREDPPQFLYGLSTVDHVLRMYAWPQDAPSLRAVRGDVFVRGKLPQNALHDLRHATLDGPLELGLHAVGSLTARRTMSWWTDQQIKSENVYRLALELGMTRVLARAIVLTLDTKRASGRVEIRIPNEVDAFESAVFHATHLSNVDCGRTISLVEYPLQPCHREYVASSVPADAVTVMPADSYQIDAAEAPMHLEDLAFLRTPFIEQLLSFHAVEEMRDA